MDVSAITTLEQLAACDLLLGQRHLALIRAVLSDDDAIGMIGEFAGRLASHRLASNETGAIAIAVEAATIIAERHPGLPLNERARPGGRDRQLRPASPGGRGPGTAADGRRNRDAPVIEPAPAPEVTSDTNAILRLQLIARECPHRELGDWLWKACRRVLLEGVRLDEALDVVGPPGWRSPRQMVLQDRRDARRIAAEIGGAPPGIACVCGGAAPLIG